MESEKKFYLVTGAAGFLGSVVCKQLIRRGDSVRALVLTGDKAVKYVPSEAEISFGDLCDKASVERFFDVPDDTDFVVIHCASMVSVAPDYNQKLMDVNVGGTSNIVDACLSHKNCKKLVYVSSTGAIPEMPKGKPISEVDMFDPQKVVGCYSQSKALATQLVIDAVKQRGLNACVVHPSGILGPEDYAVSETTKTVIQIIEGKMPMGMKGSFNLCDVRDLAQGCISAADKGRNGECYILGNEQVTLKQLCDLLSSESGCKPIRFYLPLNLASLLAKFAEKKAKKEGKKPILTTFSVYNLARNNNYDFSKASKELGYKTRNYSETIHDEVAWLRQAGKIRA